MTADLKPYPAMKPSGVEWLGEVPEHWNTRPLRHWVTINAEVLPETTDPDCVFRYVDIGSVGTGTLTQKPQRLRFAGAPSRARRIVHNGDTLVSTVRTYLKAIYFVHGEADELVCSTGFAVLTPRVGTIPKFVSYLARSNAFTDRVTADSVGIAYPAVAEGHLGSFHVAIPPLSEQAAIVCFLDHADRRIRRYIRAKQKLVKLLEEQKQALIHQIVTRGLDPNVRLKPSGVEWLGDVPEHWQMVPNRALMRLKKELVGSKSAEYLLLSLTKRGVVARDMENPEGKFPAQFDSYQVIEPGDLIFCLFDIDETPRAVGLSSLHGMITGAYTRVVCADENARRFAYLLYMALDNGKHLKPLYTGLRKVITKSTFLSAKMPLPSPPEQAAIIRFLDEAAANIDDTINRNRRQIELLSEYRTRLIADVVTGKLDVRETAAGLPDEVEEPEPFEETGALINGEEEPSDGLDTTPEESAV